MPRTKESYLQAGKLFREEAIKNYYLDPNYCLECKQIIQVNPEIQVSDTRRKKFCNSSCASTYNNRLRTRIKASASGTCKTCGIIVEYKRTSKSIIKRVYCDQCLPEARLGHDRKVVDDNTTKGEIRNRRKNYSSFSATIRRDAMDKYGNSRSSCQKCGYDVHVEICHKRSIADFPDTATLGEINHEDNIAFLCPNHHWEFDNGF